MEQHLVDYLQSQGVTHPHAVAWVFVAVGVAMSNRGFLFVASLFAACYYANLGV